VDLGRDVHHVEIGHFGRLVHIHIYIDSFVDPFVA
jgi:hypothetical protein